MDLIKRTDGKYIAVCSADERFAFEYGQQHAGHTVVFYPSVAEALAALGKGVSLQVGDLIVSGSLPPKPETRTFTIRDEKTNVATTFQVPKGAAWETIRRLARVAAKGKYDDWHPVRILNDYGSLLGQVIVDPMPHHWVNYEHLNSARKVTLLCARRSATVEQLIAEARGQNLVTPGRNTIRTKALGTVEEAKVDGCGHSWVEPEPTVAYTFGCGIAPGSTDQKVTFLASPTASDDELWSQGVTEYRGAMKKRFPLWSLPWQGASYFVQRPNGSSFTRVHQGA